jgi:phthiocerol/phenolphthiocerol synthesis type-I polyketide synthase E
MKTEEIHHGSNAQPAPAPHCSTSRLLPEEDGTTRELVRIWQEQLGVNPVTPDQNFFDLGGDSSLAVRMFSAVDQVFGVKLPLATLYDAPTIEELARILNAEVSSSRWSSLVTIQPLGSRPPLFCMHGAGGTVLMYRDLSRHLGNDQPFYGLQAQGLDGCSPPLTKIEDMAAVYVKEIRRVQSHGPYFIAGYCMGGTVALEVAQQLQQQGETIALLALFDTMNWHQIPLTVWNKASRASQQLFFHAASFVSLDIAGQAEFLREKIRELKNRIPVWRGMLLSRFSKSRFSQSSFSEHSRHAVSDSLLLGRIWQVNDRASWNYIAKPYAGMITDIRPSTQYRIFSKPDLKWERLAQGGQEVIILPVNPASMLVEPFVEHLAEAVRRAIESAMQRCEAASAGDLEVKS